MNKNTLALEIKNISKKFNEIEVLKNISFNIQKGSIVSILGPSGSGKSTLLRCINYLEKPDIGDIFIFGEKIGFNGKKISNLINIRKKIAMVFQNFNLWPHLTVLGNIIEAPVHVKKISKLKAIENALYLLNKMGIEDKKNVYPIKLSGGQKQRVAIVRALAMDPEIILFDEPTSALDPLLINNMFNIIKDLSKKDCTIIIATHEIEFARKLSNEIIFMDQGTIIEKISSDLFFSNPKSKKIQQFILN